MMAVSVKDGKKYFDIELLSNILEQKHAEAQSLLQTAADELQNLVDDSGATLLHYAAQYGNATMTQYLIDMGWKIDALDESGRSPLMLAVMFAHVATIEVLLRGNADVNIRDAIGRTILQSVLQLGAATRSADVIALFLNRLTVVCCDDDTLIANKLMEIGCNLIRAISLNRPGVTKVMLESGCSVEDRDLNCNTALHIAVELMNLDNMKVLVEHGARVNARGYHGRTPLLKYNMKFEDSAVKLEILRFLLDQGASLTMQDLFGMTPLTFLLCGADRGTLQVLMQYDVDLRGYNKFHQNPLHYLTDNKSPGVLEAIRGKNFEVDVPNPQGFTPLMLAVKNYDLAKVQFFLEHGADVNAQSHDGCTPLMLLFMNRLEDEMNVRNILELLLQCGADAGVSSRSGMTIFDLAAQNDFFFRIKPVISRYVMREVRGMPIDQLIRCKINSNCVFDYHYEKCKQQIRQLRYKIVHGSVSLFKLLFASEDNLALYARSPQFASKFTRLMNTIKDVDTYIFHTLNTRVNKAIQVAELKEKSAFAVCRITDLPFSTCHTVLYKIVDYLSHQDLEILHQV